MSAPFAVAFAGLVFAVVVLALGALLNAKGAAPLAFLVGGTLMAGGVAVGFLREVFGRSKKDEV